MGNSEEKNTDVLLCIKLQLKNPSRSPIIFKCDIPVVFYKFNMYSVQLAVKTQLIYCTVYTMYKTTCFGLFWPFSGFSCSLEGEVAYRQIYHIDDEQ